MSLAISCFSSRLLFNCLSPMFLIESNRLPVANLLQLSSEIKRVHFAIYKTLDTTKGSNIGASHSLLHKEHLQPPK